MTTSTFYREQAALQQSLADAATLANVRDRCQSAANAWTTLAERHAFTDAAREARAANRPAEPTENPDLGEADEPPAMRLRPLWSDAALIGQAS